MWATSDERLLVGLAAGDPEAAATFVARFQRRVYGVAFAVLGESGAAEEVAQETMVRAWRHASSFDPIRGSVLSWVLTIARNLAIDVRRTRHIDVPLVEEILELDRSTLPDEPEERAIATSDLSRVRDAVAALPEEQRRVLILAALHGLTGREISEREDLPLGTVKTRIRAALQKVRAAVRV